MTGCEDDRFRMVKIKLHREKAHLHGSMKRLYSHTYTTNNTQPYYNKYKVDIRVAWQVKRRISKKIENNNDGEKYSHTLIHGVFVKIGIVTES
jgi:hypothetical protein